MGYYFRCISFPFTEFQSFIRCQRSRHCFPIKSFHALSVMIDSILEHMLHALSLSYHLLQHHHRNKCTQLIRIQLKMRMQIKCTISAALRVSGRITKCVIHKLNRRKKKQLKRKNTNKKAIVVFDYILKVETDCKARISLSPSHSYHMLSHNVGQVTSCICI